MGKLKTSPPTARDAADAVRLKQAGDPAHINAGEARLLERLMPEAAGPVVTRGLLAEAGRRGDDRVTKLTPAEAALLKRRGGSGTRNPESGLLEYYGDDDGGMSGGVGDDSGGTSHGGGHSDSDSFGGGGGDGGMPSIDSLLNTPDFAMPGVSFTQYSQPDTWGRLLDTYIHGPPPSYKALGAVPGRYGMPTGRGPGAVGAAVASFGGPAMSAAMNLGMHMDQAMSPESRAASMAANQAQGSKNSTGQQASEADILGYGPGGLYEERAGTASGAETAKLPQVPPGYMMNPAGQIVPLPSQGNNRPAYQEPMQNLLMDYVLRGRQGGGLLGW